jgi:hypothetical protein
MGIYIIACIFVISAILHYVEFKQNPNIDYFGFIRFRNKRYSRIKSILYDLPNLLLLTNGILFIGHIKTQLLISIVLVLTAIWFQKTLIYFLIKVHNI